MMDTVLKLYYNDGTNDVAFPYGMEQAELHDFTVSKTRMGTAPTISATLEYPTCLDNEWASHCHFDDIFVTFNGEKFFLKSTPTSSKDNTKLFYKHELQFVSERVVLETVYMLDDNENQTENILYSNNTKYTFFGNLAAFVERINQSMYFSEIGDTCMYSNGSLVPIQNRVLNNDGFYVVVDASVTSTEEVLITLSNNKVSDALKQIFEKYGVPYYFVGRVCHIGEYQPVTEATPTYADGNGVLGAGLDNGALVPYEYGAPNSVLQVTRSNQTKQIYNRCSGTGSSDNIPYYYPNPTKNGFITIEAGQSNQGDAVVSLVNASRFADVCGIDESVSCMNDHLTPSSVSSYMYCMGQSSQGGVHPNDRYVSLPNTFDLQTQGDEDFFTNAVYYTFKIVYNGSGAFSFRPVIKLIEPQYQIDEYEVPISGITSCILYNGTTESSDNYAGNAVRKGDSFIVSSSVSGNHTIVFTIKITEEMFNQNMHGGNLRISLTPNFGVLGYLFSANDKPYCMDEVGIAISSGRPATSDAWYQRLVKWIMPQPNLMPSCYRLSDGNKRFYPAINYPLYDQGSGDPDIGDYNVGDYVENDNYKDANSQYYVFDNPYRKLKQSEHIFDYNDIKPTIEGITNADGRRIDMFADIAYDTDDDNSYTPDENGNINYNHPYFFVKLRKTDGTNGFNLFDHAIDEQEMTIALTSGDCAPCEFVIGVDKDTMKNVVQVDETTGALRRDADGNVITTGNPQARQNDTQNYEVWIALKKDITTYGSDAIMPFNDGTTTIRPSACSSSSLDNGDTFVILHIELPTSYVTAAEQRLTDAIIKDMYDNNSEKFNGQLKYSRVFLGGNQTLVGLLNENVKVSAKYNGATKQCLVSSYSYAMKASSPIPEITLGGLVGSVDELKSTASSKGLTQSIAEQISDNFGDLMMGANKPFTQIIQQNNTQVTNQIKGDMPTDYVRTSLDLSSMNVIVGAGGKNVQPLKNGTDGQVLEMDGGIPVWSDKDKSLPYLTDTISSAFQITTTYTTNTGLSLTAESDGVYLIMAQLQVGYTGRGRPTLEQIIGTLEKSKNTLSSAQVEVEYNGQINLFAIAQLSEDDVVAVGVMSAISSDYSLLVTNTNPGSGFGNTTFMAIVKIG